MQLQGPNPLSDQTRTTMTMTAFKIDFVEADEYPLTAPKIARACGPRGVDRKA
jgi:hypothetical protein